MAIYVCGKCLFCFERKGDVDVCPDCGLMFVRDATDDEILEHKRIRKELDGELAQDEKL